MLEKILKEHVEYLNRIVKYKAESAERNDENGKYWAAYYEGKADGMYEIGDLVMHLGYHIVWCEDAQEFQLFKRVD